MVKYIFEIVVHQKVIYYNKEKSIKWYRLFEIVTRQIKSHTLMSDHINWHLFTNRQILHYYLKLLIFPTRKLWPYRKNFFFQITANSLYP